MASRSRFSDFVRTNVAIVAALIATNLAAIPVASPQATSETDRSGFVFLQHFRERYESILAVRLIAGSGVFPSKVTHANDAECFFRYEALVLHSIRGGSPARELLRFASTVGLEVGGEYIIGQSSGESKLARERQFLVDPLKNASCQRQVPKSFVDYQAIGLVDERYGGPRIYKVVQFGASEARDASFGSFAVTQGVSSRLSFDSQPIDYALVVSELSRNR